LWKQHNIVELRLHRLSKRASSELVRDVLGEDCDEQLVLAIAEKAEGNAFYLEELIRFAAEGRWGAVPDNVLGMVQTRLDGLDQEVRRVLRAASIFGLVFWEDGVRALIGEREPSEHRGTFQVGEWLTHLCDLELVRSCPTSRLPGQREYQFRHALVHEAAHEMLTDTDSQLGHRLAGEWLARAGEQDSLVLAEHFSRGGQPEAAIGWLYRAAEQAFDGSDFQATRDSCQRARSLGAKGVVLGAVQALESQAAYWQSDYEASKLCGGEAIGQLVPGSESWFKALGSTLVAEARVGDTETVNRLFESALSTTCKPGAESAQVVCLCRGTFQLIFGARLEEADLALARIDEVAGDLSRLDAHTTAQVHHVRGVRAAHWADVATFLEHLEAAVAAFEKAGDVRNVLLERTTVAWCYAELGDIARARSLCEASLDRCQRQGAGQALTYAKVNLGYILGLCEGEQDAASGCLEEATRECEQVGNLRLEGWARAHLSTVYQAMGRCEPSLTEARTAVERLASTPGLQAWARACQARALLSLGHASEALKEAELAMQVHEQLGGLLQGDALAPWVFAECAQARGEQAEARRLIRLAYDRLESRARSLANSALREAFYRLPDVAKTVELHATWWASDSTGRP
jgi:tetratricopeptide (TPR) repeat protein